MDTFNSTDKQRERERELFMKVLHDVALQGVAHNQTLGEREETGREREQERERERVCQERYSRTRVQWRLVWVCV